MMSSALQPPLTLCPGTVAYMSPEAPMIDYVVHTDELDSFSPCVYDSLLTLVTTSKMNNPLAPSGKVQIKVPEM